MKMINKLLLATALFVGCSTVADNEKESEYRFGYEFKNDTKKEITITYSRDFIISTKTYDTKGTMYSVDRDYTTFDSVVVFPDSIIEIGSNRDTLVMMQRISIYKNNGNIRGIPYGQGLRYLSNEKF